MTSPADYPRVLIVAANPVSRVQSAGMLMGSFFRGWPQDRLAQIYFPFLHFFPLDADICTRYLRVSPLGIATEQRPSPSSAVEPAYKTTTFGEAAHRLARNRTLRAPLVDPVRETLALWPWLDRRIVRYARSFEPDLVYTLLGTLAITRSVAKIADQVGCPVVPHFTDHWVDTRFSGSPFGRHLRRRLSFWLTRALEHAPELFAVSGVMAEEYSRRFGKECHFLTRLVDKEPYLQAEQRSFADERQAVRFVYAGSLGLDRAGVLGRLGRALQSLQAEGFSATLEVYCSDEDRRAHRSTIEIPGVAGFREWVSTTELPALLVGADVLVHVESSDPTLLPYTRYAFSTKLSQYMMAGRCVLLVGPAEAGSMREVLRTESGVVVESVSSEQMAEVLRPILSDKSYREAMGRRAREVALDQFDASRHRERFRATLAQIAAR